MRFAVPLLLVLGVHIVASSYRPCDGKSKLGGPCDINADCDNKGSVCLRGRCRCHAHYVEVVDDKGMNPSCQRLPSKIGAECSVKCREPLFCRNGRCQCVQRGSTSLRNGECVTVSRVGDRCSRHYDCTAPFSACLNSQCVCISGTVQQGSRCVAAANCPLGGVPSGSCVRKANVAQVHNFVPDSDDCPANYVCITSEESPTGHCCPKVCPLGSHIDIAYSCEPNANITNKCPSDTHYCYRISDGGFSQASCCRRPCNALAPNALYLHGECVPRGQLNSECSQDSQCGGGEGMECVNGKCACMKSFHPFTDAITHPTNNPSQLCAKDCEKSSLSRDTSCHNKVPLGGHCFVQEQCPSNSGCYRGRCSCRCSYQQKDDKCVPLPPPPTTPAPPPLVVPGLPISGGSDILKLFGNFFNGGQARPFTAAG